MYLYTQEREKEKRVNVLKRECTLHSARTVSIAGMVVGTLRCGNNVKLNEDVKAKIKKKKKMQLFPKA